MSKNTKSFTFRTSKEEGIELEIAAQKSGMSVSSYIRHRVLEIPFALPDSVVPVMDTKAVNLFNKLGGLIKFAVLRREDLHAQQALDALSRLANTIADRVVQGEILTLTTEDEQTALAVLDKHMLQQLESFSAE